VRGGVRAAVGPALAALAATLALPVPGALAHVEVKPKRAPAGAEARLTFEVPNERPGAATTTIAIQLPAGVEAGTTRRSGGWRVRTSGRRVTLVAPGDRELTGDERGRFPLELQLPLRPRTSLTFKVLQTYDDGEVVRWIGPPGTSEPAARLRLRAAEPAQPPPEQEQPAGTQTSAPSQPAQDGGDDGGDVPIWAGIGLLLLAAVAGSAAARARNRRRMRDYMSGE
jgi:periplasmic copper chaperone A